MKQVSHSKEEASAEPRASIYQLLSKSDKKFKISTYKRHKQTQLTEVVLSAEEMRSSMVTYKHYASSTFNIKKYLLRSLQASTRQCDYIDRNKMKQVQKH